MANGSVSQSLDLNAVHFYASVASYESQAKAFEAVWTRWGRIDALLSNASIKDRSSVPILGERNRDVNDVPSDREKLHILQR